MLESRRTMRLVIGICVLLALLGFAQVWQIATGAGPIAMALLVLGGLFGCGAALAIRARLRKRYRRRLLDMRDSALW